jgi:hypothetical protein
VTGVADAALKVTGPVHTPETNVPVEVGVTAMELDRLRRRLGTELAVLEDGVAPDQSSGSPELLPNAVEYRRRGDPMSLVWTTPERWEEKALLL